MSATLTIAVKLEDEAGVKVTERVQVAPLDSLVPQLFFKAKAPGSAPVNVMPAIFKVAVPGFDKLTV